MAARGGELSAGGVKIVLRLLIGHGKASWQGKDGCGDGHLQGEFYGQDVVRGEGEHSLSDRFLCLLAYRQFTRQS